MFEKEGEKGNIMDKLISLIESVESLLAGFEEGDSDKKSHVAAVEAAIGWELPYEVRSFLVNTSSANTEEISPIFMGYELIDVKSLARMYKVSWLNIPDTSRRDKLFTNRGANHESETQLQAVSARI